MNMAHTRQSVSETGLGFHAKNPENILFKSFPLRSEAGWEAPGEDSGHRLMASSGFDAIPSPHSMATK